MGKGRNRRGLLDACDQVFRTLDFREVLAADAWDVLFTCCWAFGNEDWTSSDDFADAQDFINPHIQLRFLSVRNSAYYPHLLFGNEHDKVKRRLFHGSDVKRGKLPENPA